MEETLKYCLRKWLFAYRSSTKIFFVYDLVCIAQELPPLFRDGNALFGSKEDLDSQFFLQGLDAVADIALGRIEPLGGFVDGFAVGDLYHEAELLERHVGSSLRT